MNIIMYNLEFYAHPNDKSGVKAKKKKVLSCDKVYFLKKKFENIAKPKRKLKMGKYR